MVTGGGLGVGRGVHVLAVGLVAAAGIEPQALLGAPLYWVKRNGNTYNARPFMHTHIKSRSLQPSIQSSAVEHSGITQIFW